MHERESDDSDENMSDPFVDQHQALAGDSGSVLQVVRNPGWLLPYLSCAVVSLGMLIHFGINLSRYLRRLA